MNTSVGPNAHHSAPTQEAISQRARELWEGYGRPSGRDKEIWIEAEQQLLGVDSSVESVGGVAVAAAGFDEAIKQDKPRSRLPKPKAPTKQVKAKPAVKFATKPVGKPAAKTKPQATRISRAVSPVKKASPKKAPSRGKRG